jgi:hypothetical protein
MLEPYCERGNSKAYTGSGRMNRGTSTVRSLAGALRESGATQVD